MTREEFIAYAEGSQRALRRFLTALCCGDSSLADDIAQETLIKAWLSSDGFRNESSFDTWVRRIAYNTFLNHRRSAATSSSVQIDEAYGMTSGEQADGAFRYQELYQALARLNAKERTSLLLHYLDGYSVKEIAGIQCISENAVKQHLSRGRSNLRTILIPNDHGK